MRKGWWGDADVCYSGDMTIHQFPTAEERRRIERAGAHALRPDQLAEDNRFQGGVTDLDMARVLEALERGGSDQFRRNEHGRWYALPGVPVQYRVSATIQEGIRTGLITHTVQRPRGQAWIHRLVPAPVHLGEWNHETAAWEPACGLAGFNKGPKRTRVHRDPQITDCPRCLDQL